MLSSLLLFIKNIVLDESSIRIDNSFTPTNWHVSTSKISLLSYLSITWKKWGWNQSTSSEKYGRDRRETHTYIDLIGEGLIPTGILWKSNQGRPHPLPVCPLIMHWDMWGWRRTWVIVYFLLATGEEMNFWLEAWSFRSWNWLILKTALIGMGCVGTGEAGLGWIVMPPSLVW